MSRQLLTSPVASVPPSAGFWTLACLGTTMLLSSLGTSIAIVALPTFVVAFDTSFHAVQWVVLAYLLAVTTLIVSIGQLGDLFGRRRLMMAGIALFTAASVASGASTELWILVAARAVQGLGAAIMMALAMALVGDSVPKERVGRAMGFLGTTSAAGSALGPPLGGLLIAAFGWPSLFFMNVPLGLLALVLAYRFLPRDLPRGSPVRFDLLGSSILAIVLATYALSMTLGRGSFGAINAVLLCAALGGAFLFVVIESRLLSPLIRPALLRDRNISTGFAMSALVTTVAMTTLVVGPFYLTIALGLSPIAMGMVMTAGPLVATLAGMPAGRGVEQYGARRMTVVGVAIMTAGCSVLAVLPVAWGVIGYVLPLATTTVGFAIFQAANNTVVVTGVDARDRGVAAGLLSLSRNLGMITGASAMGAVFSAAAGKADVAAGDGASIAIGMNVTFAAAALLAVIALALAIAVAKRSRRIQMPA
ncbi:MAG: MFS transporter [Luteimonas sp.]